ncbi:uncharacterized protein LOC119641934 [Glossina fuscipes]|uniref:Uncharacterized protein LOC119641934 n=1 Tax=Glossina fuscipes TaxID=7396 RepID=A0A9C5ZDP5_9MUSC|nr:uncharacterized protein LOC119641934 [Glossina fuscipes]
MSREKELAMLGERYISFDRQEIRAKILMPTYAEARRRKGSIYATLIKELYEGYCPTTAGYFEEMVIKEQQLFEKQAIRQRVCDEPYLLFSLYDHCKLAEQAMRLEATKGQDICVRLLFQCMFFCEDSDKLFNWLNEDLHEIVANICNGLTEKLTIAETLCKVNYKYAQILTNKDIAKAVNYLQTAFDLARGTNWLTKATEEITKPTSDFVVEELAKTLLKCAYLEDSAAKAAIKLAEKLDMKRIWAQCLTDMAKIYLEHRTSQASLAEQCLLKSREILTTLKDVKNLKLCNYDLARVKSRMIYGNYMEAIKNSSTSRCEFHRLLEWKTRCKPFWTNRAKVLQLEQKNPVACLLQSESTERTKLEAKIAAVFKHLI